MKELAQESRRVVERFKQLMLERGVPFHSAILFGSRARGDFDIDSDYDVLVVVERLDQTIRRRINLCAWEAGIDECLLITPVPLTRDDIENGPARSSLLMEAVRTDGVTI